MSSSDIINVVEIALTIGGFAFAFWQLHTTKNAVDATKEGVDALRSQIIRAEILIQVQSLITVEAYIEDAAKADDATNLLRYMRSWQHDANELCGLLENHDDETDSLVRVLKRSVRLGADPKEQLVTGMNSGLAQATTEYRQACSKSIDDLGTYRAKIKLDT